MRFARRSICFAVLMGVALSCAAQDGGSRRQITELFEQAQQAEQAEDFSRAAGLYRQMLAMDPGIAEVWSNLGMALYRLGENGKAVAAFERASAVKPRLLAPHIFTGMVYLRLGEPEKSLSPLKAALAIEPNQPEAVLALSDAYAQTHQFALSVRLLRKALQSDPNSEDIGSRLAATYFEWGKTVGVELRRSSTTYGRLLAREEIAAEHSDSAEDRVRVPSETQDSYAPKLLLLQRAQAQRRLNPAEVADYASAAWHLRRYEESLAELSQQTQLTDQGKYWLFRTCLAMGKQQMERTVNAHPDSVRSHLLLANLALQQEDLLMARTEYQAALRLRPDDPEILLLYVRFLETAGDPRKALAEAKRGAAQFPASAGLNYEAGDLILLFGNDDTGALKYLEQSVQSDAKPVRPHVDLAQAYARMLRLDDAIREIGLVLNADEDGTMHYRLAGWYRQAGHPEKAAEALEACRKIKLLKLQREREFASQVLRQSNETRPPG